MHTHHNFDEEDHMVDRAHKHKEIWNEARPFCKGLDLIPTLTKEAIRKQKKHSKNYSGSHSMSELHPLATVDLNYNGEEEYGVFLSSLKFCLTHQKRPPNKSFMVKILG